MYDNITNASEKPAENGATPNNSADQRQALAERLRRNVPQEMRARRWWVLHHRKKYPATAEGDHLAWKGKSNWMLFEQAIQALLTAHPDVTGIGVVLPPVEQGEPLPDTPLSCVDLDDCLNEDGTPKDTPGLRAILERFNRHYIERSPSGHGLHGWYIGPWLPGVTTQLLYKGQKVEVYERKHFVTVTGDPWTQPDGTLNRELAKGGREVGWLDAELKAHGVPVKKANATGFANDAERGAAGRPNTTNAAGAADSSIDEVRRCLAHLPGWWRDDYAYWIRAGMAAHDATGGSAEGLALWDDWSRGSDKYKDGETAAKWAGFRTGGGVGIKTLRFHSGLYPDMERPEEDFAEFADPDWDRAKQPDDAAAADERPRLGKGRPDAASATISLALELCELFHDEGGEAFAEIRREAHREIRPVKSRSFAEWLSFNAYRKTGKVPADKHLKSALDTLSGVARFDGEQRAVFRRVARHGDAYWIDLCDEHWRAVKVTAAGWSIEAEPPVMFQRSPNMRPLPEPQRGGDIDPLWSVVNIPPADRITVLAWMLECFRPDKPYPVLELTGHQGTAKSGTQRILRGLIDPNKNDLRGAPKNNEDLIVAAHNAHLVSLNNLSRLSAEQQDILCNIATDGGHSTRALYSTIDEESVDIKRPVILNGIQRCRHGAGPG